MMKILEMIIIFSAVVTIVAQQIVIRKQMREIEDMSVKNWKAQRQVNLLAKNLEWWEEHYMDKGEVAE